VRSERTLRPTDSIEGIDSRADQAIFQQQVKFEDPGKESKPDAALYDRRNGQLRAGFETWTLIAVKENGRLVVCSDRGVDKDVSTWARGRRSSRREVAVQDKGCVGLTWGLWAVTCQQPVPGRGIKLDRLVGQNKAHRDVWLTGREKKMPKARRAAGLLSVLKSGVR
jgi:hypothetical protein